MEFQKPKKVTKWPFDYNWPVPAQEPKKVTKWLLKYNWWVSRPLSMQLVSHKTILIKYLYLLQHYPVIVLPRNALPQEHIKSILNQDCKNINKIIKVTAMDCSQCGIKKKFYVFGWIINDAEIASVNSRLSYLLIADADIWPWQWQSQN